MNQYDQDERLAEQQADVDTEHAEGVAAQFLLGEVIKAATRQLKELAMPFSSMSQEEQEVVLERMRDDCYGAVSKAVTCIATGNRVNFRAEVKSVQFLEKAEVKAQLIMFASPEAHALADTAGRHVMVVIEDGAEYLEVGDACDGEPDQPALFDTSTEGSGWQEPEAA